MKAISLTQPWASLVALGEKSVETRGWRPTSVLGDDIAIHASNGFPLQCRQLCDQPVFAGALKQSWTQLPIGAVIAVVNVMSFYPTEDLRGLDGVELAFGDYGPKRFGWFLQNVRPLAKPVPCRGALGIWSLPAEVERQVAEQLRRAFRC